MKKFALLVIAVMVFSVMGASAQIVRHADGQFEITATRLGESEPLTQSVNALQLLGKNADGTYLVLVNGQFMNAEESGLDGITAFIKDGDLPSADDFEPLSEGAKGDGVAALQKGLQSLGYLGGEADGDFDSNTTIALEAFQIDHGMEPTGEADANQQMLIQSLTAEAFVYDSSMAPGERFEVVENNTEANLDALYASNFEMEFDYFEGTGFISDNSEYTFDASGNSDIEQAQFTMWYGLDVVEEEEGEYLITPVLKLKCLCARRPVMQNVIIVAGNKRVSLPVSNLENKLSGAKSVETCTVELDENALEVLSHVGGDNDFRMRVEAKYQRFDLTFAADEFENLSMFVKVAQGLQENDDQGPQGSDDQELQEYDDQDLQENDTQE